MEPFYPLRAYVCGKCFLVQLEQFEDVKAIFSDDYAYFSSYADSWLTHCKTYADGIIPRLSLTNASTIVELASNDGYLLQFFRQAGIPVLGVEPAVNVADAARRKGIPTISEFFGEDMAKRLVASGTQADLLIGNNVLAHVPDLNDFVRGLRTILRSNGTITMEFPHLLVLMQESQFDTIYHEHFSYFSFHTIREVFGVHQLRIYDVERLRTHGGSLRIYACHAEDSNKENRRSHVEELLAEEREAGLRQLDTYRRFSEQIKSTKRKLLRLLTALKDDGKSVVAYGAPAKGNTLLNYCGIRTDFLDYTVDRSPHKQGRLLPGTRIPVYAPERIWETKPDFILILPWNLRDEILSQLDGVRNWGAKFIVPIPVPEVC